MVPWHVIPLPLYYHPCALITAIQPVPHPPAIRTKVSECGLSLSEVLNSLRGHIPATNAGQRERDGAPRGINSGAGAKTQMHKMERLERGREGGRRQKGKRMRAYRRPQRYEAWTNLDSLPSDASQETRCREDFSERDKHGVNLLLSARKSCCCAFLVLPRWTEYFVRAGTRALVHASLVLSIQGIARKKTPRANEKWKNRLYLLYWD